MKTVAVAALFSGFSAPIVAQQEEPLSAIDWLSETVVTPQTAPNSDVTDSAAIEEIETSPLGQPSRDGVGLLPVSVTGFPRELWGPTPSEDLARALLSQPVETYPALQALLMKLLLAEVSPPSDTDPRAVLFQARIDKLLDIGALDQAASLMEITGTESAEMFRRYFDIALLIGVETAACENLQNTATMAPTLPARVFCLARTGDWNAAALTLETGRALGYISEEEDELLARFLDPELFEGADELPLIARPSPLTFRLYEAIGEPIPTTHLPRAFAQTDLNKNNGWRARLQAAEKLAASGAVADNVLFPLYTDRKPPASGGLWDRVAAVQDFDDALRAKDTAGVALTLPKAQSAMAEANLLTPFARYYTPLLAPLLLDPETAQARFHLGLLTDDYETVALQYAPGTAEDRFLVDLAKGMPKLHGLTSSKARAIVDGFNTLTPPPAEAAMLKNGEIGRAILSAMTLFERGSTGDPDDIAAGLTTLRALGLEDVARRAALQLMLLERS
ncbi:hypothetical protein OU789_06985 [Halocynthiibacter sp. C4]|uniref:hypothetical protein n=1 Tax=Halocynthiibacter sp. C4 TaxID=2992758 RepID=UPI00237C1069|nr:hypothetical protein [Halocynthiibacter sp. C4]MDE0589665.1 hypothetical protein [Halocynthiibacter sp. C4]